MRRLVFTLALGLSAAAFARPCPKIMFVLDAGGSMNNDPAGGMSKPSKFDMARQAIINFVNTYADRVQIGITDYASDSFRNDQQCVDDTLYDPMQCQANPEHHCYGIVMDPDHGQGPQLVAALKAIQNAPIDWHDPLGETITRVAADPAMMDTMRPNYIVLITDGVPSCNSQDLMDLGTGNTPSFSIQAINNARNQMPSIHTWVVGFDGVDADGLGGLDKESLSEMAQAGGEPYGSHQGEPACGNMTPCYYSANGTNDVQSALSKVIDVMMGGEFGSDMCDDSCYSNGCQQGYVCVKMELDPIAKCVPDPCQGAQCSGSQFCRMGQCVGACTSGCNNGQKCVDGNCVQDLCWGINCPNGQACNPGNGQCVPDLCQGVSCNGPTRCDPVTGKCVDDQCHIITCPAGTTCQPGGNCSAPNSGTGRGKGCAVASPSVEASNGLALATLGLLAAAFLLRRRKRHP